MYIPFFILFFSFLLFSCVLFSFVFTISTDSEELDIPWLLAIGARAERPRRTRCQTWNERTNELHRFCLCLSFHLFGYRHAACRGMDAAQYIYAVMTKAFTYREPRPNNIPHTVAGHRKMENVIQRQKANHTNKT